jgi:hypothetical protein
MNRLMTLDAYHPFRTEAVALPVAPPLKPKPVALLSSDEPAFMVRRTANGFLVEMGYRGDAPPKVFVYSTPTTLVKAIFQWAARPVA